MTTNWKIQIDWDRDGDFTTAIDDVTNDVMQANWFLGFRKPYDDVANEVLMVLKLRNNNRRFSARSASATGPRFLASSVPSAAALRQAAICE
jgi:hypothetical protein